MWRKAEKTIRKPLSEQILQRSNFNSGTVEISNTNEINKIVEESTNQNDSNENEEVND